jgi:hypothetical protein
MPRRWRKSVITNGSPLPVRVRRLQSLSASRPTPEPPQQDERLEVVDAAAQQRVNPHSGLGLVDEVPAALAALPKSLRTDIAVA